MRYTPPQCNEKQSRIVTFRDPSKLFSGMVDKFILLEGKDYEGQRHEVLPKSNFRLVFTINNTNCGLSFLGPNTKMRIHPLKDYFVVHFLPGMMPLFADLKPTDLTEKFIPLKKVLGTDTATLVDTIQSTKSFESRQRFMEEFFRRSRLETVFREGPHITAVQMIRSCHGQITVSELAGQLGLHIRTIERMFLEHVGLSPKKFIRLIRFQAALQHLKNDGPFANLADLAYSFGYTDQSHLIKDFKSFSHRSPSRI
jgi:AraC-like DNA-binding protein